MRIFSWSSAWLLFCVLAAGCLAAAPHRQHRGLPLQPLFPQIPSRPTEPWTPCFRTRSDPPVSPVPLSPSSRTGPGCAPPRLAPPMTPETWRPGRRSRTGGNGPSGVGRTESCSGRAGRQHGQRPDSNGRARRDRTRPSVPRNRESVQASELVDERRLPVIL